MSSMIGKESFQENDFKSLKTAFQECVTSMCVSSYPCGKGSWRSADGNEKDWSCYITDYNNDIPENGAQNERTEELTHLITSQIYATDDSWSKQVIEFREMSIRNPDLVTHGYIEQNIQNLDLSGREITHIHKSMKGFKHLQRLSLTGNCLKELHSHLLPQSITELELSGNKLQDINTLLSHELVNLQYLGVSHNKLENISSMQSGLVWPQLMVLDLSFNAFEDLFSTIQPISKLKTLRSLCLIGNPVMLCKVYRGYVIDSLPWLKVLDDSNILVSEKLKASGLGQEQGKVSEEVEIEMEITTLNAQKEIFPDVIESTNLSTVIKRHIQVVYSLHIDTTTERWDATNIHHTEERNQSEDDLIQFSHLHTIKIDTPKCARLAIIENLYLRIVCHDIEYGTEPLIQETHKEDNNKDPKESHENTSQKQKQEPETRKSAAVPKVPDNKQQKKHKDKKDESKLYEWSRTTTVIRTAMVSLQELLQGTKCIESEFQFDMDNDLEHTDETKRTKGQSDFSSRTSSSHHSTENGTKNDGTKSTLPEKKSSQHDHQSKNGKASKKQKGTTTTSSHKLPDDHIICQELLNPTLSFKLKLNTQTHCKI